MLSQILSNGIEVLAIVEGKQIFAVLLPIKFDVLIVHIYYYIKTSENQFY